VVSFSKVGTTKKIFYEIVAKTFGFMVPKEQGEAPPLPPRKKQNKKQENEKPIIVEKPEIIQKQDNSENSDSNPGSESSELGMEYPFVLKYVNVTGTACSRSPWYAFNIGTPLLPSDEAIDLENDETVAVDWKPELYTLKYIRLEGYSDWFEEHPSCKENWENLNKPISLDQCMKWFTQEEALSEELYCPYCQKPEKIKKKNGNLETPSNTYCAFEEIFFV